MVGLRMDKNLQGKFAGIGVILGCIAGIVAGGMAASPPLLQDLLENTLADAAVVILALGTVGCLFLWARQSASPDGMAYATAITFTGVIAVLANVIAPALGWWRGPYFETRLVPLALLTGLKAMAVGLFLAGYRWLAAQRPRLALVLYGALVVLLIPGIISGDRAVIDSGLFTFANGYQIWHDVILGVVLFILPLIVYEALSRAWRKSKLQQ